MIVTFVSECQKKSLNLTRQVLDAYAHRIGQRTWQTVMTQQGLDAVRARLSRTARKTTAVACHRIRGSRRTELLWIVGDRRRFDDQGNVPVNRTRRDLLREHDENDWTYLSTIKPLIAIAALFHDFGKAWDPFQKMLRLESKPTDSNRDPIRHEWVSLLLFVAFVQGKSDKQWLEELERINELSRSDLIALNKSIIESAAKLSQPTTDPFRSEVSPLAQWIGWLIVSHHRLPHLSLEYFGESHSVDSVEMLGRIRSQHGYTKIEGLFNPKKHWKFESGLPCLSGQWRSKASRWSRRLLEALFLSGNERCSEIRQSERLTLTLARAMLMLADHQVSSLKGVSNWLTDYKPYANTHSRFDRTKYTNKFKQSLDQHLVGVTDAAVSLCHLLPSLETELPKAINIRPLRKPSPAKFEWQNRVVSVLKRWQLEHRIERQGFFAINMASTGKGKTFANARIMDVINPLGLRFSLALGLRTLTLQTGNEYRNKMKLNQAELAILVGSIAVRLLHDQQQSESKRTIHEADQSLEEEGGSESEASLMHDYEFAYDDLVPDDLLSTQLSDKKSRQLLKSPILVCTVDHLMPAVESTRGGKHILPLLRMLSADLVIDEVDDFDQRDLPAIARLVHLAGMLGRKVMISSATIPPAIAEGLFHSYQEGWQQFANFRGREASVACLWVDEYSAIVLRTSNDAEFEQNHKRFVTTRVKSLARETNVRCRATLIPLNKKASDTLESRRESWRQSILDAAIQLHEQHAETDKLTGKRISLGVIRVANVDPCIDLGNFMLRCELPGDFDLRVIVYHARQVLLLRSEQERMLDRVLSRQGNRSPCNDELIRSHLNSSDKPNVIFAVVASPVEEVGRDHDFDWAVVEPSSMRSIIQMAGRVRRHRDPAGDACNVGLPQYNLRGFATDENVVFNRPGFESDRYCLDSKSLTDLLNLERLKDRLDASSRILSHVKLQPTKSLVDLEHQVLRDLLTMPDLRPGCVNGWTQCAYYLTDLSQQASRFRQSGAESTYRLHIADDDRLAFRTVDPATGRSDGPQGKPVSHISIEPLDASLRGRLWLPVDYAQSIDQQQIQLDRSRRWTCELLGEISLRDNDRKTAFRWTPELGARRS